MILPRLSIRARITGGSLLIALGISIVAGLIIYAQVERIVTHGVIAVLDNVESPYLTALRDEPEDQIDHPGAGQLVTVVDPSGTAVVSSLPAALATLVPALVSSGTGLRTVPGRDASYLVRVTAVASPTGTFHVISAVDNVAVQQVLQQVTAVLVGSIAIINLAFGVAAWFIGSAALRPVTRLRRSAARLVTKPDGELLRTEGTRDEIARLAETLNELISQLRASADRERQIVSDASHELRTPLAVLQTQLELAQAEASSLAQMQADVAAAQNTVARLSSIATSLLELSRIDAQVSPGSATVSELAAELADAADRGRQRVGNRDIQVEFDVEVDTADTARTVAISTADFGRVCDNLVGNSLTQLERSGTIELRLSVARGRALLTVRDDAGGMPPEFVAHALDRFSRGPGMRSSSGSGLGLAIVAGIASVAGGTVGLENRVGEGLTVRVELPLDPTSDQLPAATRLR